MPYEGESDRKGSNPELQKTALGSGPDSLLHDCCACRADTPATLGDKPETTVGSWQQAPSGGAVLAWQQAHCLRVDAVRKAVLVPC